MFQIETTGLLQLNYFEVRYVAFVFVEALGLFEELVIIFEKSG